MPKFLVIIVAGFIILAGGTVTVMSQMKIGPFAPEAEAATQPTTMTAEERPPDIPKFITMDPIVLSVYKGDRVAGTIQLHIQIEVSEKNAARLKLSMPKLKDAYLQDLNGYLPRLLRDKKEVDVSLVKQRLQIIGDRSLGKGVIDSVLIQSVLNRVATK
jgi:flagellar basal body-associated protein FliL